MLVCGLSRPGPRHEPSSEIGHLHRAPGSRVTPGTHGLSHSGDNYTVAITWLGIPRRAHSCRVTCLPEGKQALPDPRCECVAPNRFCRQRQCKAELTVIAASTRGL